MSKLSAVSRCVARSLAIRRRTADSECASLALAVGCQARGSAAGARIGKRMLAGPRRWPTGKTRKLGQRRDSGGRAPDSDSESAARDMETRTRRRLAARARASAASDLERHRPGPGQPGADSLGCSPAICGRVLTATADGQVTVAS